MDKAHEKLEGLKEIIAGYGSLAVAFSGGVDSTFLLKVASEVLGDKVLAITAASKSFPERELTEARAFCRAEGIAQEVFVSNELELESFRRNPENRCYICKKWIFGQILEIAAEKGISVVAEGSNVDDDGDYRPGMRAIKELRVESPLHKAGLTKEEIRVLSKEMDLPTWDKPSYACLATRFVYGETIDAKKLLMVEKAEQLLFDLGFHQFRVRIHGRMARIELQPREMQRMMQDEIRLKVHQRFKEFGFTYVTLDLLGYRMGSMNETIMKA